jgi:hypothetical protein
LLYRSVDLDTIPGVSSDDSNFMEGSLTRTQKFARELRTTGPYIREVSIRVLKPDLWSRAQDVDRAIVDIFLGATQLEALTIIYDIHDSNLFHLPLLTAVPHLAALKHITLKEAEFPKGAPIPVIRAQDRVMHIGNRFLATLIAHYGQNLRSINLHGSLRISRALFWQLREGTPNLETLHIRKALSLRVNPLFHGPNTWSCARTLKSLTLMNCNIHAEHIATQLALGVFGPLRHLSLYVCGHRTDDQSLRPTVRWKSRPLETFRLHHFIPWEVDALSIICTRLLVATKVEPQHLSDLIRNTKSFPALERIRVSTKWRAGELTDLREAAASRGVEVVPDWDRSEDPLADEFHLIDPCPCFDCRRNILRL